MKRYLILAIISVITIFNANAFAYVNFLEVTVAPQSLSFNLTNPLNSITGYSNGMILTQIPNLSYKLSGTDMGDDTPTMYETFYKIDSDIQPLPTPLPAGLYRLTIYNNNANAIISQIMIELDSSENIALTHFEKHLIYPNSSWVYEFIVPAVPPAPTARIAPNAPPYVPVTLAKVSQPTDLIKDINTAASLNYIGNPKFVSEIIEDINEIEKKRAKMLKNASRSETEVHKKSTETYSVADNYHEILQDITEAYTNPTTKKFITVEGYNVLKEDLEYIIAH